MERIFRCYSKKPAYLLLRQVQKECRESSSIPYNTTFAKHASNSGNSPNDQWEISALEAKRKRLVHSSLHYIPRLSSFTVNSVWKVNDTCIIFKHTSENCQKLEISGLRIRLNTFVPNSDIFQIWLKLKFKTSFYAS